jgi:hypothetical protein
MTKFRIAVYCIALVPALACGRDNKQQAAASLAVQRFYDWYVPLAAHAEGYGAVLDSNSIVSPELVSALREDYQAQARDSENVVGLDFDAFLATQDPCERYVAGKTTTIGQGYLVEVYAICDGNRRAEPDAAVELVQHEGSWSMVNIRYPRDSTDLLTELQTLAKDRGEPPRSAPASKP